MLQSDKQSRKIPPSLIHKISLYLTGKFQFKLFRPLNRKTRKDLVELVNNQGRVLTFDLTAEWQFPLLSHKSYKYFKQFAQHFTIKMDLLKFNANIQSQAQKQTFTSNQSRLCSFFELFLELQLRNYTFSLQMTGTNLACAQLISQLLRKYKVQTIQLESVIVSELSIDLMNLVLSAQNLIILNSSIGNSLISEDHLKQKVKIRSLLLQKFTDLGNFSFFDYLKKAHRLEGLQLTENSEIIISNKAIPLFQRLKILQVNQSKLYTLKGYSFYPSTKLDSIEQLYLSFDQVEEIEQQIIPQIMRLQKLQKLQLCQNTQSKALLSSLTCANWVKDLSSRCKSLMEIDIRLNKLAIQFNQNLDTNFLKLSVNDCMEFLGNQVGLEIIGFKKENSKWIKFQLQPKELGKFCCVRTRDIQLEFKRQIQR
ncbi:hypothetical protein FGO68_gene2852 [Halteria grandinella]|uniref:Uncharacterized protein n=1 Tax=Halteria grandinella TaxID=5974 RepID=A0A8J8T9Z3_HALGN|nr:hypothetical protein FGO68_gene2852 [Halteria grandinella]